ncbi:DMT family transporter [Microbacterium sp. MC2]
MTARPLPAWIALGGAVLTGVMTAVQARINGQLGLRLDDGILAAAISFGSGLVLLIVLTAALPAGRRGFVRLVTGVRGRTIPWWMLVGGAAGALTTATQGLAVAIIGVSLFTVGVVAGQAICGLVLDRTGYGPSGVVAVTMPRVAGGALAIAAVVLSLQGGVLGQVPWWMLVLPLLTGIGISWQQATNGRLRQRIDSPMTATLVNFIGGTAILLVAAGIHIIVVGPPQPAPTDPWLYLGGVLGVIYIILSAALVAYTGVLLFGLGSVTGQLVTAYVLDLLWPAEAAGGWLLGLITIALAICSVVVAAAPWRRRRRHS